MHGIYISNSEKHFTMSTFDQLSSQEQDWLDEYLDGTISPENFESLQDRLLENPELRFVMRRYLSIDNVLQNESADSGIEAEMATAPWLSSESSMVEEKSVSSKIVRFPGVLPLAAAAGVAFLLGTAVMQWIKPDAVVEVAREEAEEPSAVGFAVMERLCEFGLGSFLP